MIDLRYHIVSLVAVFLALGAGFLLGTTVLGQRALGTLQTRVEVLADEKAQLRKQVRELEGNLSRAQAFLDQSGELLVKGKLDGRPVIVFVLDGTRDSDVKKVLDVLAFAGARLDGAFKITAKVELSDSGQRSDIASKLKLGTRNPPQLRKEIALRLAERLSDGAPGAPASAANSNDALAVMLDSGLASPVEVEGALPPGELPSPQTSFVVLAGARTEARQASFAVELARVLASREAVVAVGEAETTKSTVVVQLRNRETRGVVTIDGISRPEGVLTLPLALEAAQRAEFGHYGREAGADRLLPRIGSRQ